MVQAFAMVTGLGEPDMANMTEGTGRRQALEPGFGGVGVDEAEVGLRLVGFESDAAYSDEERGVGADGPAGEAWRNTRQSPRGGCQEAQTSAGVVAGRGSRTHGCFDGGLGPGEQTMRIRVRQVRCKVEAGGGGVWRDVEGSDMTLAVRFTSGGHGWAGAGGERRAGSLAEWRRALAERAKGASDPQPVSPSVHTAADSERSKAGAGPRVHGPSPGETVVGAGVPMLGDDGTELPPASQSEEMRARDGGVVGARGASSSRAVAVATVVTTREYLVGALVMLHSLRQVCGAPAPGRGSRALANVELVVVVSERLREGGEADALRVEKLVRDVGASVRWVEPISSPHRPITGRAELVEAYTKLHVFNLTEFSKVVYYDADVVHRQCALPQLLGAQDLSFGGIPEGPPPRTHTHDIEWVHGKRDLDGLAIGSALMVLQPGARRFAQVLAQARAGAASFDGADLGLLYTVFYDRSCSWRG